MDSAFFWLSKILLPLSTPLGLFLGAMILVLALRHPWRGGARRKPGGARNAAPSIPADRPRKGFRLPFLPRRKGRPGTADASAKSAGPRPRRRRKVRGLPLAPWLVILGATLGLWALSTPLVSQALLAAWERPLSRGDPGTWDALVVLGGSIIPDAPGGPGPRPAGQGMPVQLQVNGSVERLFEAARLYHAGAASHIIVSGGSGDLWEPDLEEASSMARVLQALGVPPDAVIREPRSRNTAENLLYVRDILREFRLGSVLVITSASHMRRVEGLCRHTFDGLMLAGQDTPLQWGTWTCDTARHSSGMPEAVYPSLEALADTTRVLREVIGYAAYSLSGRI